MKIAKILAAVMLCGVLAACATTSTVTPPDRPNLTPPDALSMRGCLLPVHLPPGSLTQADIEKYWGTDRAHQIDCAKRHKILADYIRERDSGLIGVGE